MAIFWRINSEKLTPLFETPTLGFPEEDPSFIPDEYLEAGEFIIFRTCHSIGDWGIISAMPKLLKTKYPNCKVYIPSANLLQRMFSGFTNWNHWSNPFANVEVVFKHNPFVDGFIDNINAEVFHDHYRVYDLNKPETSLIVQMMKFWQLTEEEYADHLPELYFSKEEKEVGDSVIQSYIGHNNYGTLLLTNTVQEYYSDETNRLLLDRLQEYKELVFFYYGAKPIEDTIFKELKTIDFKTLKLPIRVQLYLKTKALVNIGYQSGVNDSICRYSKVICTPSTAHLGADYLKAIEYIRTNNK
jgi:hypothetical protein